MLSLSRAVDIARAVLRNFAVSTGPREGPQKGRRAPSGKLWGSRQNPCNTHGGATLCSKHQRCQAPRQLFSTNEMSYVSSSQLRGELIGGTQVHVDVTPNKAIIRTMVTRAFVYCCEHLRTILLPTTWTPVQVFISWHAGVCSKWQCAIRVCDRVHAMCRALIISARKWLCAYRVAAIC